MYPPLYQGSYGGKWALRRIALICANSIGFSPPQDGCHESGLRYRKSKNTPNVPQKTISPTTIVRLVCRSDIERLNRCIVDERRISQGIASNARAIQHQ